MKKIPQDIIGEIAILKFKKNTFWIVKKFKAYKFLRAHKNVKTVVEKVDKFSGEMRILKTRYLAGIRTFETVYRENDCTFKFDINKTYFSPRLSNERKIIAKEVAKYVKKNAKTKILVCFSGVGPYPIIIAKELKNQKKKASIISNEINSDACIYAKENVRINKLNDYITIVCDDAKNLHKDFKEKFDIIIMPRPNIKYTFLKEMLKLSKSGTIIYYHGFGTKESVLNEIQKDTKGKIGKIKIRKAGDIAVKQYRFQAEFKVK